LEDYAMQPIYTLPESFQAFQTALAFPDVFRPRAQESHKGTYGTLAIIGGATGMSGAGGLAATAALSQGGGHKPRCLLPSFPNALKSCSPLRPN